MNAGLRWEFATPIWDRDNYWSNFDPTTNTLVRATRGSLYNRALVHPDYKDFGPRLGVAYSIDPKTSVRAGYGISYTFFNRPGSAIEGINGPLAIFGTFSQTALPGPPGFLTTQNGFNAGIATHVQPGDHEQRLHPRRHALADDPVLGDFDPARASRRTPWSRSPTTATTVSRLPIIGDYNQAAPNAPGGTLGVQAGGPIQSFGPITWVDPAGDNNYNGLSVRLEHRFSKGFTFEFVHVGQGDGRFRAGAGIGSGPNRGQSAEHSQPGRGNRAQQLRREVQQRHQRGVSASLRQRASGSSGSVNRIAELAIGGWELNAINTANTGIPINVFYAPSAANDVTGLATNSEYRGTSILRPNVTGPVPQLTRDQSIANYFGPTIGATGSVFALPTAMRPSATWDATPSVLPAWPNGTSA